MNSDLLQAGVEQAIFATVTKALTVFINGVNQKLDRIPNLVSKMEVDEVMELTKIEVLNAARPR
jgi:hypothetical protein